ncbi:MAG: hypothetical protein V4660_14840 [Pseudomonadota bacterium]
MNELQRQLYLSAIGVDTYMPRWQLPFASISNACVFPVSTIVQTEEKSDLYLDAEKVGPDVLQQVDAPQVANAVTPINQLIGDLLETNKVKASLASAVAEKSIELNLTSSSHISPSVTAFSLSVWRPNDNLMIIDSRNTKLALPTELLLANILRSFFPNEKLELKNEVLRWPMIENNFAAHTAVDARTELQTWLSVQCEIRPIKYLWLMGENAGIYFLPLEAERNNYLWLPTLLEDLPVSALILPSCNELLQQPLLKNKLCSAFKRYHI